MIATVTLCRPVEQINTFELPNSLFTISWRLGGSIVGDAITTQPPLNPTTRKKDKNKYAAAYLLSYCGITAEIHMYTYLITNKS